MSSIHDCAAWTQCGSLLNCGHSHGTVGEAVACIRSAGGYLVAVDAGTMRSLNHAEEAQFQFAVRNSPAHNAVPEVPVIAQANHIDSRYAVMTWIKAGGHWTWTTWMCFETYAEAYADAQEDDRVVRFRSAEWHALRQQTGVVPPSSNSCADGGLHQKHEETLVELVLRLLETCELEAKREYGLEAPQVSITSEVIQCDEIPKRKRA